MYTTVQEVKTYSSMASTAPDCSIKTIELTEASLFLNELKELKPTIDKYLIDYSGTEQYDNTNTYNEGDVCIFEGEIRRAKETVEGVRPDTISKWELAPKFDNECVNDAWCKYIAPLIAHGVVKNDVPIINAIADRTSTGGYTAHKVIETVQQQALRMYNIALQTLRDFVESDENNCLNLTPSAVGCDIKELTKPSSNGWATKFG